jgi:hypothetical protein
LLEDRKHALCASTGQRGDVNMKKEPSIGYQQNKKAGVVYVYEDHSCWDPEKKQSRSIRKLLGKLNPSTGNIVPTRGRNAKKSRKKSID